MADARACCGMVLVARMCANGRPGGPTASWPKRSLVSRPSWTIRSWTWRRTHAHPQHWIDPVRGAFHRRGGLYEQHRVDGALERAVGRGLDGAIDGAIGRRLGRRVGRRVGGCLGGRRRPPASDLKIGVVTDVGTVNDKNFNQFTYAGAVNGAVVDRCEDPGRRRARRRRPTTTPLLQAFVDQGYNVIVATGFNLATATAKAAKANPNIWFIGVDHDPCINETGDVDTDVQGLHRRHRQRCCPNYIALNYQEDQAGYLAGIVAANATKSGIIGAIGGVAICGPCVRYIQGYALGAQSINPDIKVKTAWVTASDFKGFSDQAGGKTFGDQFIKQNPGIDVLFQVAGHTGNGVIDAACAAKINAIGVDVDQYQSYAASQACILTSAEKHLSVSVVDVDPADRATAPPRAARSSTTRPMTASACRRSTMRRASCRPTSRPPSTRPSPGMKAGTVVTCPPAPECGKTPAPNPIVPAP